jgi:hypothetical protein
MAAGERDMTVSDKTKAELRRCCPTPEEVDGLLDEIEALKQRLSDQFANQYGMADWVEMSRTYKRERDELRAEVERKDDALRGVMDTPPDYRPSRMGHNERKAWQIIDEMKKQAHSALTATPHNSGESSGEKNAATMDLINMLVRDNNAMKDAGSALAAAAARVVQEYDGVHRLSLAAAKWHKAVANEGGRGTVHQSADEAQPEQPHEHRWVERDASGALMCADCGVDADDLPDPQDDAEGAPECPECHLAADRPKCAFGLGSKCPRPRVYGKTQRTRPQDDAEEAQPDSRATTTVPSEPTDTMMQEGAKTLPVEGPVTWMHMANVYREMIAVGEMTLEYEREQVPDIREDEALAGAMLDEIIGRRGFRQEWQKVDAGIQREIEQSLTRIARKALRARQRVPEEIRSDLRQVAPAIRSMAPSQRQAQDDMELNGRRRGFMQAAEQAEAMIDLAIARSEGGNNNG